MFFYSWYCGIICAIPDHSCHQSSFMTVRNTLISPRSNMLTLSDLIFFDFGDSFLVNMGSLKFWMFQISWSFQTSMLFQAHLGLSIAALHPNFLGQPTHPIPSPADGLSLGQWDTSLSWVSCLVPSFSAPASIKLDPSHSSIALAQARLLAKHFALEEAWRSMFFEVGVELISAISHVTICKILLRKL